MITNFKSFISNLLIEELHPELQEIVKNHPIKRKQEVFSRAIQDLTRRGEKTGIEGNMPKGSSRAYMQHETPHDILLDGKPTKIKTGTKIAITATLDKFHKKDDYNDLSLGQLQNEAENNDGYVDSYYRILTEKAKNVYKTNTDQGIFPPLIDHDGTNHNWSHVGHIRNFKSKGEFEKITKTPEFPNGISHEDFCFSLLRDYNKNTGKYYQSPPNEEKRLDSLINHPLLDKFLDYHRTTGNPPHDYQQLKNMGVFEHPDGSKHIVARDHGFSLDVQKAYADAQKAQFNNYLVPKRYR